ncbi:MAG: alpha/beta fold hydrolase [Litorimonas sp.]
MKQIIGIAASLGFVLSASGCTAEPSASTLEAVEVAADMAPEDQQGWLSFRTVGTGPDVILLPGLASAGQVWDGTVAALKDQYRFHIAEVAGFAGQPAADPRVAIIDGLSDDAAAYIKAQNLNQPIIVGHSMGGFTSLHVGRDHGEQVGGVISVDSLPFYPLIFNANATVETSKPMADQMVAQMKAMPKAAYDTAQAQSATRLAKGADTQARIANWGAASDRDIVLAAMSEIMTTDFRSDLSNIDVPVTVIYAHDPQMGIPSDTVDRLYATAYLGTKNLSLDRVDGSFHFIMDDQPDAFVAALSAALATYTNR